MEIHFKKNYTVHGEIDKEGTENHFSFVINLKEYKDVELNFNLDLKEKELTVKCDVEISSELLEVLSNQDEILRDDYEELNVLSDMMHENAQKFMRYLKYSLNQYTMEEALISLPVTFQFSMNNNDWLPITMGGRLHVDTNFGVCKLNSAALKEIKSYFHNNYEPLLAMKHIHRAKKEVIPRYKWIETTIALELAIKEVLIRKSPDAKILLLELPSPPLQKLYNQIFTHYFKEEIPKEKRNIVIKGAEIRNKLVHSPQEITIKREDAIAYVYNAEELIFYILKILYPEDYIINKLNTPTERGTAYITIHKDLK